MARSEADVERLEKEGFAENAKLQQQYGVAENAKLQQQYGLLEVPETKDALKAGEVCDIDDPCLLVDKVDGLYPCLDVTRIVCICVICVDHGGTKFGVWNTMFVQAWVLQYIFIVAGICYGLTSRGLCHYVSRLSAYFVVGVCCNLLAYCVKGLDWQSDMWNVVFQFWFILGLMSFLALLTPLKHHLKRTRDRVLNYQSMEGPLRGDASRMNLLRALIVLAAGCGVIKVFFQFLLIPLFQFAFGKPLLTLSLSLGEAAQFWALPQTLPESEAFLEAILSYFQLSASSIFLICAFPMCCDRLPLVGWLVILNTYAHRAIQYRAQEARLINGFDVTMLGLVCYYYGLSHRRVVGEYMCRYWFVMLFVSSLLWPPGTYGRFDEHPPFDLAHRAGSNLLEMQFVLWFLCGMERMVDHRVFSKDRLHFLGYWAFGLFLVHKAVHILVPWPYNWFVLLSGVPMAYYWAPALKPRLANKQPKSA